MSAAQYVVTYRVNKTGKTRTRVYNTDGQMNAMAHQSGIAIISVQVINSVLPGFGLSWLDYIKGLFR